MGGGNKSFRGDRNNQMNQQPREFKTNLREQQQTLETSESAWKAKWKQDTSNKSDMEIKHDHIKRQTRAILNKLTPQSFSTLSKEMALLDIDSDELVSDVIDILFDKACMESNFAEAYANMCKTVLSIRSNVSFKPEDIIEFCFAQDEP